MQASSKLPAIACFLCFFAIDAIHIQVNPTPSIASRDPNFAKTSVTAMSQFAGANLQQFAKTSFNVPLISHITKTVNLMAANGTQLNLVSGGKCSNADIAHLSSVAQQMLELQNKVLGGAMAKPEAVTMSATSTEFDPSLLASCAQTVAKFDWSATAGCVNAITGTSSQCSSCFVQTIKDSIGGSMFAVPFSCMSKCLPGSGPPASERPECVSCTTHNIEKLLDCTGIDLEKFAQGAAEVDPTPLGGGASSVLPHWAVTMLLGAVTLGGALIF